MIASSCFVLFAILCSTCDAFNILFIPMHFGESHKKSMLPVAEALGRRGHRVYFWTPDVVVKKLKTHHIIDDHIVKVNVEDQWFHDIAVHHNSTAEAMLWTSQGTNPLTNAAPWIFSSTLCNALMNQQREEIDKIVNLEKWDLIIYDGLFAPCSFLIVKSALEKLDSKTGYVAWSTTNNAFTTYMARAIPVPLAHYSLVEHRPIIELGQSLADRVENTLNYLAYIPFHFILEIYLIRYDLREVYEDFSFDSFEKDALISVTQAPQDFDWPRPMLPDYFATFPTCPKAPKKTGLTEDMRNFIEDPKSKGTIIIAFGHFLQWSSAPTAWFRTFQHTLESFSDYRVIWQSDIPLERASPHIRVLKWLPQMELLFHPKTVLFVSHSGLKSILEAICAGVPILSMPQFAEQYRNNAFLLSRRLVGFIDKFRLEEGVLKSRLEEMVANVEVQKTRAVKFRAAIEDKPIKPIDYETFLIEYAARHRESLRRLTQIRGVHLSWIRYFLLDVIGAFFAVFGLIVFGATHLLRHFVATCRK